jgi:class 3 adenylate cyclase/DNA-binding winged helix-turn-helix (wHTH) protein
LIAVVYADMVGYSRLIGLDDVGTLERYRSLRQSLIDPAIEAYGGRIVQTGGDSLLIVFDSIDGAIGCAVKIQQQVPAYDADQPPSRSIRFRVGVNIGDAITDGTDLHGDGINVAVRLQSECPPGSVCVSRAVRDHIRGRLAMAFEELGALNLKNIGRSVEAFVLKFDDTANSGQQEASVCLVFGNHVIDLRRQELRRAGEIVHVEPQVYDLLVHLVRNRGRVVSKDELLDTIWNGRIVSEAALSSRINAARKAIGDDGDRQALIKTIHRRGFRFIGAVQEGASAPVGSALAVDGQPQPRIAQSKRSQRPHSRVVPSRKPSIAVLPFANLSKEPDTDYFSYGLTEDGSDCSPAIAGLMCSVGIPPLPSRPRDRSARDRRRTGNPLPGAGTVVKHGERVRITADLVSAETGHHLWWESHDAAGGCPERAERHGAADGRRHRAGAGAPGTRGRRSATTGNLGAWDCYQRGLWHLWGSPVLALPRVKRCSAERSIWIRLRAPMAPWPTSRCRACASRPR